MMPFADRRQAGRLLATAVRSALATGPGGSAPVVAGLPRGGVPVAAEVAAALDAPLDVLLVRKVGVPFQPELAMGAIGEGDLRVVDQRLVASLGITAEQLAGAIGPERLYLEWIGRRLRESRPPVPLDGRTVVVVDDGFATGATAAVACRAARAKGAAHVVAAAPVGSHEAVQRLLDEADQVVVLHQPRRFVAVGRWYTDFGQISEQEVADLLVAARSPQQSPAAGSTTAARSGAGRWSRCLATHPPPLAGGAGRRRDAGAAPGRPAGPGRAGAAGLRQRHRPARSGAAGAGRPAEPGRLVDRPAGPDRRR